MCCTGARKKTSFAMRVVMAGETILRRSWLYLDDWAISTSNVGIAIINHPPNHQKCMVETIKNGWLIIAIPTIYWWWVLIPRSSPGIHKGHFDQVPSPATQRNGAKPLRWCKRCWKPCRRRRRQISLLKFRTRPQCSMDYVEITVINHPWLPGNGRHTIATIYGWWLGDGSWNCYTHIKLVALWRGCDSCRFIRSSVIFRASGKSSQRPETQHQLPAPHGPAAHQVVECIHDMNGNHVIQKVVALWQQGVWLK